MSFVCTVILVSLCLTEISKYVAVETKSDMLVDISHHDDRLNINVDIVFPRMPCEILSLDVQDVMGTHIVDVAGELMKKRLSQSGEVLSEQDILASVQNRYDMLVKVREELD